MSVSTGMPSQAQRLREVLLARARRRAAEVLADINKAGGRFAHRSGCDCTGCQAVRRQAT
jgi:hypothetical protein